VVLSTGSQRAAEALGVTEDAFMAALRGVGCEVKSEDSKKQPVQIGVCVGGGDEPTPAAPVPENSSNIPTPPPALVSELLKRYSELENSHVRLKTPKRAEASAEFLEISRKLSDALSVKNDVLQAALKHVETEMEESSSSKATAAEKEKVMVDKDAEFWRISGICGLVVVGIWVWLFSSILRDAVRRGGE
jgi:hypothetical protein